MSTSTFEFQPLGRLILAHGNVFLQSGNGAHRLTVQFSPSASWLAGDDAAAVLLAGQGWTTSPGPGMPPLAGLQPVVWKVRGYPAQRELAIDLSDEALLELDRASTPNAIAVELDLTATLLAGAHGPSRVEEARVGLQIPRGRWIELLDSVGAAAGITLRIPSPLTDSRAPAFNAATEPSRAQAAARLREARRLLRDGDWEHTVLTCRKVLENIAALIQLPSAKSVFTMKPDQRSKEQRFAVMYYDLYSLTCGAAHDKGVQLTYDQGEAESILAITAALLLSYTRS